MKNLQTQFAVLLLSTICLLTGAYGQITPSQDAYTNSADPTTNYGAAVTLGVVSSAPSIQTTYIQFDLSSIPAGYTSANIAKATLKLYVNAVTTAGSFNVDYVNGAWTEKTIKASLAPALGSTIVASVPLTSSNVHDYVLIDVTSAVDAWLNGTQTNDGIALVANSPLSATIDSKESTTQSHPAELDVVFNGAITGVTTAGGSGLTGGGTSGTLNLSLTGCAANQVLQYNGSSWACSSAGTGTITGVGHGTYLTGGGTSGNVTLNLNTAATNALYAQLGAANTFTGNQTVTGTLTSSSSSSSATVVEGNAAAATGITTGVLGVTQSTSGTGVNGLSTALTGVTSGVAGGTNSPTGYGVYGSNSATTGNALGVFGATQSPTGYGVYGSTPGTNQNLFVGPAGVFGVTNAIGGAGVFGVTNSTAAGGTASGVTGITFSPGGFGVQGANQAITGTAAGVAGSTQSPAGYGVWGISSANSGGTAGFFQVLTSSATILQGNNNGTSEFKVDSAGDVIAAGAVTAAGAVSGSSFQIGGALFDYGNYGYGNAFLGFAGSLGTNVSVHYDTAVGSGALFQDSGGSNTAVGLLALDRNTTGATNTAIGYNAGATYDNTNLTGSNNTALGAYATFNTGTLSNATAVGAGALVSESNALVLGSGANVGIGTSTPGHLLDVAGGIVAFDSTGLNNGTGIDLTFGVDSGEGVSSSRTAGPNQYGLDLYTDYNRRISIEQHGNVGIGTTSPDNLLTVNGSADKPGGGSWGTFSDGRLKTVNGGFTAGLSQVMKIHPVHYRYKPDNAMGIRDTDEHIGVVAQEVKQVIPEAVTENSKGYLLVNNDPIIWTMLNAIKEQQGQIRKQQSLLRAQSAAMRSLKAEVRETRESLRKVKAQVVAAQPALVAAK